MNAFKIDIGAIDTSTFEIKRKGAHRLITPKRSKHVWRPDELHLRSVMVDDEGYVVSSGFPKFFNYGENAEHDGEFECAFDADYVRFPEKLDGSLIIIDWIDGRVNLRTRGSMDLGAYSARVLTVIRDQYPALGELMNRGHSLLDEHSLLFEYVSPDNNIVIGYQRPELYALGMVNKVDLSVTPAHAASARLLCALGAPVPASHALPVILETMLAEVGRWKGKEGVVASFPAGDGSTRMLKIKADDYIRLHTLRGHFSPERVKLMCYLLGVESMDGALPAFSRFDLDFEAVKYASPWIAEYLALADHYRDRMSELIELVRGLQALPTLALAPRKDFVEAIRRELSGEFSATHPDPFWFAVAMKVYELSTDNSVLDLTSHVWPVIGAQILGVARSALDQWSKDADKTIRDMLSSPTEIDAD